MKTFKLLTFVTCLVLVCSVVSCADDDIELYEQKDLIGEWERIDPASRHIELIVFGDEKKDHNSYLIFMSGPCEYFENGLDYCVSAAYSREPFTWNTKYNLLTLNFEDDIEKVTFSIDHNGQLRFSKPNRLTDYKDFYYKKVNYK